MKSSIVLRAKRKRLAASNCLVPPGAEFLAWSQTQPSKLAVLVAVLSYNHLIDQHVVAFFDVVNANLRIFFDLRSFDNLSI